jgi:hypothetical protein
LDPGRLAAQPGGRLARPAPIRQNHIGPVVRARHSLNYFDLENPASLPRLSDPGLALRSLKGLVATGEIQRRSDLFPLLRVLADRQPLPARFLILGSVAPDLLKQSPKTLADRLEIIPFEVSGWPIWGRLRRLGTATQVKCRKTTT